MANWRCKCGNNMNDIVVPNPYGYVAYSEKEWENILELSDENDKINRQDLSDPSFEVYKCPECGRLMVFGETNSCLFYKPEE